MSDERSTLFKYKTPTAQKLGFTLSMETITEYFSEHITNVGDNTLPLSVQSVLSNDDLLTEILLRLPVLSLLLFKSVSKHWLSLIKDTNFIKRRGQIPKIDLPSGLFVAETQNRYDFVRLDIRIPANGPYFNTNTFQIASEVGSNPFVMQACNGLLLCYARPSKFYVYNPSINLFKLFPKPHISELKPSKAIFDMKMDFDPTKSPHYKLVHVRSIGEDNGVAMSMQIQTYSSETGVWSVVCDYTFPNRCFSGFSRGIYLKDAIHWLSRSVTGFFHYKLDFVNKLPVLTNIQLPVNLDEKMPWDRKLYESRGCLLLLGMDNTQSHQLNVYEMRNGSSEWSFKFFVNLDDIMMPFPEKWTIDSNVWCIALGESEEDSFMVIGFNYKAVLYKIVSKTFRELHELELMWAAGSFLFTASFASV